MRRPASFVTSTRAARFGQKVSRRPSDIEMVGALSLQQAVEDLDETSSMQSAIANSMLDHGSDRMSDRMSDNMSDDGSAFEDATSSHLSGSEIEEDELRQALEQSLASAAQDGGANLSHSSASRQTLRGVATVVQAVTKVRKASAMLADDEAAIAAMQGELVDEDDTGESEDNWIAPVFSALVVLCMKRSEYDMDVEIAVSNAPKSRDRSSTGGGASDAGDEVSTRPPVHLMLLRNKMRDRDTSDEETLDDADDDDLCYVVFEEHNIGCVSDPSATGSAVPPAIGREVHCARSRLAGGIAIIAASRRLHAVRG